MTLLDVTDLTVAPPSRRRGVQGVRPLSFTLEPGETVGLLGEPGSGSTEIAQAIAGLGTSADIGGSVVFDGRDLLTMSERELAKVREVDIALMSPATGLRPPAARRGRTKSLPAQPKLLVLETGADGIDGQVRELVLRLQAEAQTAVVIVTRDLATLVDLTDLVIELYAGKAVEFADGRTLSYRAHHPYSLALVSQAAAGSSLEVAPTGCPYHLLCPYVMDRCITEEPPPRAIVPSGHHRSACWLPLDLLGPGAAATRGREEAAQAGRSGGTASPATAAQPPVAAEPAVPVESAPLESAPAVRSARAGRPAPPARPRAAKPAVTATTAEKAPVKKAAVKKAPAKRAAPKAKVLEGTGVNNAVVEKPAPAAARTTAKKAPARKSAATRATAPDAVPPAED